MPIDLVMKNTKVFLRISLFSGLLIACAGATDQEPMSDTGPEEQAEAAENSMVITEEQYEIAEMRTARPVRAVFPQTVRVNGFIDVPPKSKAAVSTFYGGYVGAFDLLPGQRVRSGQLLFTLEHPDFVQMQQDYLEATAQLPHLQADFERQKTLAGENIASQKNYLKAESDYQVQLARSAGLRKKLQMLQIDTSSVKAGELVSTVRVYAPISGFITKINITSGSFLEASDIALEITNTEHLHLELSVFEKDIRLVKKGQQVHFRIPGMSGAPFAAEVYLIGGQVEGEGRTLSVHGHLEEAAERAGLLPGMYVEATLETTADSAMALPESAVVRLEEGSYVLLQLEKDAGTYTFRRRPVRTGRTAEGMVEILDDLSSEDLVLVNGAFDLIVEE